MKKIFIVLVLLCLSLPAYSKDITITIPDELVARIESSLGTNDIAGDWLKYLKQRLTEYETFQASIIASENKRDEIKDIEIGTSKGKVVGGINWTDVDLLDN